MDGKANFKPLQAAARCTAILAALQWNGDRRKHPHCSSDEATMKPSILSKLAATLAVVVWWTACATSATAGEPLAPLAAFAKDARILFQGDSITDGNRGRSTDPNHILGHGYVFLLAAKFGAAFPDLDLDFMNRGISGNTVLDLERRWQKDTLDLKPDVLSVLIGVNDEGRGIPLDQYEQVYDKLLVDAKSANPAIRLVLCEPFGLPVGARKATWTARSEGLQKRQQIVARLAEKHHAALVHFQRAFDEALKRAPAEYWIWDAVHPTYRGHQIMADEWERTVRAFWPQSAR
jgi:lysophospholipase L1-like esterase